MKRIETLTIQEVLERMRQRGMGMSYQKLTAWADAGLLPFAISAPDMNGQQQRTFFKKLLIKWLDERSEEITTEVRENDFEEFERVHHGESLL